MNRKKVEDLRKKYPEGTVLEMVEMVNDPRPIEKGTRGTVRYVDDMGTIHMAWQNGRTLGICPEVDKFKIVTEEVMQDE